VVAEKLKGMGAEFRHILKLFNVSWRFNLVL